MSYGKIDVLVKYNLYFR